jgi:septal ring factor EnvC (AmiA/AmiB activator)
VAQVDAALLSEKMKASAGQQDVALKNMQTQLSKAEKIIAEMRDAYAKTKADAEQTVNSRDEEIARLTKKIAELTLALKQANDNVDELQKTLAEFEVVEEEEEEVEEQEESE